jgi:tRNA uridine 5-carbamoylmethylation protein Kti12
MQNSTNKIHVENQDDASENRWIKVITDHHKGTRREVFHQASKQIDVVDRFALLTNLQVQ